MAAPPSPTPSPTPTPTATYRRRRPQELPSLTPAVQSELSAAAVAVPRVRYFPIFQTSARTTSRETSDAADAHDIVTPGTPHTLTAHKITAARAGGARRSATGEPVAKRPSPQQTFLDFGQKDFAYQTCGQCGMLFSSTHAVDVAAHRRFHARELALPKSPKSCGPLSAAVSESSGVGIDISPPAQDTRGFCLVTLDSRRNQRVLRTPLGPRARLPNVWVQVLRGLGAQRGFALPNDLQSCTVFYLMEGTALLAVAVVRAARWAERPDAGDGASYYAMCPVCHPPEDCPALSLTGAQSETPWFGVVVVGVWVRVSSRRTGVATRLLDSVRATSFFPGSAGQPRAALVFAPASSAPPHGGDTRFSDDETAGECWRAFLTHYTKTANFTTFSPCLQCISAAPAQLQRTQPNEL